MGKYTSQVRVRKAELPKGPHSIWNTIGCLMLIIVPVMSIAGAVFTVQTGLSAGWPIPPALLRPLTLPGWIYVAPGLASLLLKVVSINYLPAYILFSFVYIVILGGFMSVIYAALYRMTAPSKYGPLDAPPVKGRIKQYKR